MDITDACHCNQQNPNEHSCIVMGAMFKWNKVKLYFGVRNDAFSSRHNNKGLFFSRMCLNKHFVSKVQQFGYKINMYTQVIFFISVYFYNLLL